MMSLGGKTDSLAFSGNTAVVEGKRTDNEVVKRCIGAEQKNV